MASASPTTLLIGDVPFEVDPENSEQMKDLSMYLNPQVNVTSILVAVDRSPIAASPVRSRPGDPHADTVVVNDHLPAIAETARERYERSGEVTTVSMTLNRNPCGGCAPAIAGAQRRYRPHLQIDVYFAGPWADVSEFTPDKKDLQPEARKRIVDEIMVLLEAGVNVDATPVWRFFADHHFHWMVTRLHGPENQLKEELMAELINEARTKVQEKQEELARIDDIKDG